MILYQDFSNVAAEAIEALEARREEIGKQLQESLRILRSLKGGAAGLEEFLAFWNATDKPKFEQLAIKTWLTANPPNIALSPGREHLAVPLPADARDLWKALEAIRGKTSDPARYWDKGSARFFGLPVTDEEAERITARYVSYARSEEHLSALQMMESTCFLINFANKYRGGNITPASLEASAPWISKLSIYKKTQHPRYNTHVFVFEPDLSIFCEAKENYRAFDEANPIS